MSSPNAALLGGGGGQRGKGTYGTHTHGMMQSACADRSSLCLGHAPVDPPTVFVGALTHVFNSCIPCRHFNLRRLGLNSVWLMLSLLWISGDDGKFHCPVPNLVCVGCCVEDMSQGEGEK